MENKKAELTFNLLAQKSRRHLDHIIATSKNKEDLLFRLSGFCGELQTILRKEKLI